VDLTSYDNILLRRGGEIMNPTAQLRSYGQSLWLDNITRDLLNSGTLERYVTDLSITGLTSNPTIFDHAIKTARPMTLQSWKDLKKAGVDALGPQLQSEGAEAFLKSWNDLMDVISAKGAELTRVG
jgi:transaldolase